MGENGSSWRSKKEKTKQTTRSNGIGDIFDRGKYRKWQSGLEKF